MIVAGDGTCLVFSYVNHRGETGDRHVRPIRIWFGSTAWHREAQWLLEAWDLDRQATRDFALAGIRSPLVGPTWKDEKRLSDRESSVTMKSSSQERVTS